MSSLPLSGSAYVSAVDRNESNLEYLQIPLRRRPEQCDHVSTICPTMKCVASWSIDHRLMPWRTAGGRDLAATLGFPSQSRDDHFARLV